MFINFKVGCCGASGSEDYIAAHKPVPVECRDMSTGNEYPAEIPVRISGAVYPIVPQFVYVRKFLLF